jgi:DNA-binding protein HU-beta
MKMNKSELITSIAGRANLSKSNAKAAVEALMSTIQDAMKNGDKVSLVGFGTFSASTRPARSGRNPQTGETIQIAARRVPKFTPGRSLKNAIQ